MVDGETSSDHYMSVYVCVCVCVRKPSTVQFKLKHVHDLLRILLRITPYLNKKFWSRM